MLNIAGKAFELSASGFLLSHKDWDREVASVLASKEGITLEMSHWEVVDFIRDYYLKYNHLPNARLFVQVVRKVLGEEKGNSRYLHRLFPGGPVKQACKIAGLGKPPGCM